MGELHSFNPPVHKKKGKQRGSPKTEPHSDFVVQLDEEMFAFEAQLADLRPAEGVDFGVSLKRKKGLSGFLPNLRTRTSFGLIPERPGPPSA